MKETALSSILVFQERLLIFTGFGTEDECEVVRGSFFYLQGHQTVQYVKMMAGTQYDEICRIIGTAFRAPDDMVDVEVSAAVAARHLAAKAVAYVTPELCDIRKKSLTMRL